MPTDREIIKERRVNRHPTFSQWIYFQCEETGIIGKVARWIAMDLEDGHRPCWPHRVNRVGTMVDHLLSVHAGDSGAPREMEIRKVYHAYHDFLDAGGSVPVRTSRQAASTSDNIRRGYLLSPATIERIRELSKTASFEEDRTVSQSTIIERLVERAYADRVRSSSVHTSETHVEEAQDA